MNVKIAIKYLGLIVMKLIKITVQVKHVTIVTFFQIFKEFGIFSGNGYKTVILLICKKIIFFCNIFFILLSILPELLICVAQIKS